MPGVEPEELAEALKRLADRPYPALAALGWGERGGQPRARHGLMLRAVVGRHGG